MALHAALPTASAGSVGFLPIGLLLDFYAMRFYHWGYAMAFTPAGNAQ
jgi:hypothetical protein